MSELLTNSYKSILMLIIDLRFKELSRGNRQFDVDHPDRLDPLTVYLIDKIIKRMLRQEAVGSFLTLKAIENGCSIEQIKKICEGHIMILNDKTKDDKTNKEGINYKQVLEAMRNINKVMREAERRE